MFKRKSSKRELRDDSDDDRRRKGDSSRSVRSAHSTVSGSSSRVSTRDDREHRKRSSRDGKHSRSHHSPTSERSKRRHSSPVDDTPSRRSRDGVNGQLRSGESNVSSSKRRSDVGARALPSTERSNTSMRDSRDQSSRTKSSSSKKSSSRAVGDEEAQQDAPGVGSYDTPQQYSQMQPNLPNQFPDQIPLDYAAPSVPGVPNFGAAAEFYGDQGQSVAYQPGVRPATPIIVGAEPHLLAASAEAAPPEETGHGAAAEFFAQAGDELEAGNALGGASQQPMQTISPRISPAASPRPSKPVRPSKPSRPPKTSSGTLLGAAGAAALTASALNHTHSHEHTSPSGQHYSSTVPHKPPRPQHQHATSSIQHESSTVYDHGRPPRPQHQHSHQYGTTNSVEHRDGDRGPLDKFAEWWNDYEDVQKMEEYTEYIGVCRHCFDPHSSPMQAPRAHRPRKVSSRESLDNIRVDKQRRYQGAGTNRSHKRNATWLGAGLGAFGVAKFFGAGSDSESNSDGQNRRRRHTSEVLPRRDSSRREGSPLASNKSTAQVHRTNSGHGSANPIRTSLPSNRAERNASMLASTAVVASSSRNSQPHRRVDAQTPIDVSQPLGETFDKSRHVPTQTRRSDQLSSHTGRHTPSLPSSASSSSSEHDVGFFNRVFSTPKKKKQGRDGRHRQEVHSSEDDPIDDRPTIESHKGNKRRPGNDQVRRERRSSDERAKAALAGLGVATAALAAHQAGRNKRSLREDGNGHQNGLAPAPSRKHKMDANEDEDGWESASGDSEGSADSALAFGGSSHLGKHKAAHSSSESLSSAASGTDKWGWRWGKKRRDSPHRQPDSVRYESRPIGGLNDTEISTPVLPMKPQVTAQSLRQQPEAPLQYVEPKPLVTDGATRRVAPNGGPISTPQPLVSSRVNGIPLQQPQPLPPPQKPPPTPSEHPPAPMRRVSFADELKKPRRESDSEMDRIVADIPPKQTAVRPAVPQRRPSRPQKSPVPSPKPSESSSDEKNAVEVDHPRGRKQRILEEESRPHMSPGASAALAGVATAALIGAGEKHRREKSDKRSQSEHSEPLSEQDSEDLSPHSREPVPKTSERNKSEITIPQDTEETVPFPTLPIDSVNEVSNLGKIQSRQQNTDDALDVKPTAISSNTRTIVRRPKQDSDSDGGDTDIEKFNPENFRRLRNTSETRRNDQETSDVLRDLREKYTERPSSSADLFLPEEMRHPHEEEQKVEKSTEVESFSDSEGFTTSVAGRAVPVLRFIAPTPPPGSSRSVRFEPTNPQQSTVQSNEKVVSSPLRKGQEAELSDEEPIPPQEVTDKVTITEEQSTPQQRSSRPPESLKNTRVAELKRMDDFYQQPAVQSVSDVDLSHKKPVVTEISSDLDLVNRTQGSEERQERGGYNNEEKSNEAIRDERDIKDATDEFVPAKRGSKKAKKPREAGSGISTFASATAAVTAGGIGYVRADNDAEARSGKREATADTKRGSSLNNVEDVELQSEALNGVSDRENPTQTNDRSFNRENSFNNDHGRGKSMPGSFDDFEQDDQDTNNLGQQRVDFEALRQSQNDNAAAEAEWAYSAPSKKKSKKQRKREKERSEMEGEEETARQVEDAADPSDTAQRSRDKIYDTEPEPRESPESSRGNVDRSSNFDKTSTITSSRDPDVDAEWDVPNSKKSKRAKKQKARFATDDVNTASNSVESGSNKFGNQNGDLSIQEQAEAGQLDSSEMSFLGERPVVDADAQEVTLATGISKKERKKQAKKQRKQQGLGIYESSEVTANEMGREPNRLDALNALQGDEATPFVDDLGEGTRYLADKVNHSLPVQATESYSGMMLT